MSKRPIEDLAKLHHIEVKTIISGETKVKFVEDIKRGYKSAEIMRCALRFFYESNKDNNRY